MIRLFFLFLIGFSLLSCQTALVGDKKAYDICIYGGSSAGVIAAYAAKQMGKSVILISPDKHLGGLSSSGLGATDIGNKYAVTGLSRDFYRRLGKEYGKLEAWTFEPHKAEKVFQDLIKEAEVEVLYDYRLKSLEKEGTEIQAVTVENGSQPALETDKVIRAAQFIDATYVGDLMAAAGVSYTVGRESNDTYDETLNGVQIQDGNQFPPNDKELFHIDPYRVPGDSTSGLCWGISPQPPAPKGSGDKKVQAYNYRLCLTQDTNNMAPIARPENYDSTQFELLRRLIQKRHERGWQQKLEWFYLRIVEMPNGKTDMNNKGPMSTDYIGMNYNYPEADYEERKRIEKAHEQYIRSFLYFLSHDPRLPEDVRSQMGAWGWAKDEFTDNNYFPYKLYIREARRMIGEYVMTEHHCRGDEIVENGIGMAAYNMDSHNCQRAVVYRDGKAMVQNEGDVQVGGFPPYPISYRSLTPKREECTNLLVPVCLSASHIAYGSIRMEPVFMVLGQSAAMAAAMAIARKRSVQEADVAALQERLLKDPLLDGTPPDILVDNEDAGNVYTEGEWEADSVPGRYKTTALIADNSKNGQLATFSIPIVRTGQYGLYYYVPGQANGKPYTDSISVAFSYRGAEYSLHAPVAGHQRDWAPLGRYTLEAGDTSRLMIMTDGAGGYLPADAVLLAPEHSKGTYD